jgi:hypothetical protein
VIDFATRRTSHSREQGNPHNTENRRYKKAEIVRYTLSGQEIAPEIPRAGWEESQISIRTILVTPPDFKCPLLIARDQDRALTRNRKSRNPKDTPVKSAISFSRAGNL